MHLQGCDVEVWLASDGIDMSVDMTLDEEDLANGESPMLAQCKINQHSICMCM